MDTTKFENIQILFTMTVAIESDVHLSYSLTSISIKLISFKFDKLLNIASPSLIWSSIIDTTDDKDESDEEEEGVIGVKLEFLKEVEVVEDETVLRIEVVDEEDEDEANDG